MTGQKSNETRWVKGVPEHKFCNFLLIVKPEGCNHEHIVKAFYAEKFKIEVECPDDDDGYDKNGNEEYFLQEGFYEDSQWYNDEGLYFEIPEKDIIAWQQLPEIQGDNK